MARLIEPPLGLPVVSMQPLSGPRTVGAARTETIGGLVQTVASPLGLWRWQFSFAPMNGDMFRRYRGWITAMHGGANATRWHFYDPDIMAMRTFGGSVTASELSNGVPWSNDMPWDNGQNWQVGYPHETVAASSAKGSSTVRLQNNWWGYVLEPGDMIGFFPSHFGLYMVTEVISDGRYRIWPPLRKALTSDDYATLKPTLAMRLESEEAASAGRGLVVAEGATVTMIEVFDYDVKSAFTD